MSKHPELKHSKLRKTVRVFKGSKAILTFNDGEVVTLEDFTMEAEHGDTLDLDTHKHVPVSGKWSGTITLKRIEPETVQWQAWCDHCQFITEYETTGFADHRCGKCKEGPNEKTKLTVHRLDTVRYELWRCEACGTDTYWESRSTPTPWGRRSCTNAAAHAGVSVETRHTLIRIDDFKTAFDAGMKRGTRLIKTHCNRMFTHAKSDGTTEQRHCALDNGHKGGCA